MTIGLDTMLCRNGDILHSPVGEEAVMMSISNGHYYSVDAVGARIWELLETPVTVSQICARLSKEFEVDMQTCEAEVLRFVNDLVKNGIVRDTVA